MMGSFLTRGLAMVLGYAYPAYECFKSVEMNKPEIDQLRFWCQYWILVAMLTVLERVGDTFISWLPMYGEAKLAFFVYLWYPKTKGTTYIYDTFLQPYIAKHESEIDRNLHELKARAGDIAVVYWQKAASFGQTMFFETLQFVVSQSSRPRPAPRQQQPPPVGVRHAPSTVPQPAAKQQPEQTIPHPPASVVTNLQLKLAQDAEPPLAPASISSQAVTEATSQSAPSKREATQIEEAPVSSDGNANPAPQEVAMEEAIRVTRGRLRKTRATRAASTPKG